MKGVLCYAVALRPGFLFELGGHEVKVLKVETEKSAPFALNNNDGDKTYITVETTGYGDKVELGVSSSFTFLVYGPKTSASKE